MAEFQPVLPVPHFCSATAQHVDVSSGTEHSRHQLQHPDQQVQEDDAHNGPTLPGTIADEVEDGVELEKIGDDRIAREKARLSEYVEEEQNRAKKRRAEEESKARSGEGGASSSSANAPNGESEVGEECL